MGYKVAVVGATGNVGRELLKTLAEREFRARETVRRIPVFRCDQGIELTACTVDIAQRRARARPGRPDGAAFERLFVRLHERGIARCGLSKPGVFEPAQGKRARVARVACKNAIYGAGCVRR